MENIAETLNDLIVEIDTIKHRGKNPRKGDVELIKESLEVNGQYRPIVVNKNTGEVLAGNHTLKAAKALGWEKIAATFVEASEEQAARIVLVDNRANDVATYDNDILIDLLSGFDDLKGTGYDEQAFTDLISDAGADGEEALKEEAKRKLAEDFIWPPFSVLDARNGEWQNRKRSWKDLGIESEVGRDSGLVFTGYMEDPSFYSTKEKKEKELGRKLTSKEFSDEHYDKPEGGANSGTSVFDPVLCELLYRWFCPPGGQILDPFAGGSVRGVVAGYTGRDYTGIDLSKEQVGSNRDQAAKIFKDEIRGHDGTTTRTPQWIVGDSTNLNNLLPKDTEVDFVFSCPPYGDLEQYSDAEDDLSNMSAAEFDKAYEKIIATAIDRLKPNAFAAFVVGEYRGKDGNYEGLVPKTIDAFTKAGAHYYNEVILVTPVGSLSVRASRPFRASRKIGKTHQNVLVFVKGDIDKATKDLAESFDTKKTMGTIHETVLIFLKGEANAAIKELGEVDVGEAPVDDIIDGILKH